MAVSTEGLRVVVNGCERSRRLFDQPLPGVAGQAWIAGESVSPAEAVHEAASILRRAIQPAFGGLATDVAGVRAVLDLADRTGGVVDHLGSRALMRNMLPLQESGWITATFAEVRNRADLIIVAGTDVVSRFPRFFERVAFGDAMFVQNETRDVVFIGENAALDAVTRAGGRGARRIGCRNGSLAEIFGVLHGILTGSVVAHAPIDGVALETLQELAERMRRARYGVLAWAAADLDFSHADLAVAAMCSCVRVLNENTRFAALPLAGNDADTTANQVCLWQTGYPLRIAFANGRIDYDPHRYGIDEALSSGDADALVWIASFDAERVPPATSVPVIVLARRGMRLAPPPAVQIDVATPGLDHAGHFYRGDSVVAVRLRALVDSALPSVAAVIGQIAAAM
ncbi:MAG TPA: hypothetical protein VI258_14005 [Rhodanobacteraceae bacterium]